MNKTQVNLARQRKKKSTVSHNRDVRDRVLLGENSTLKGKIPCGASTDNTKSLGWGNMGGGISRGATARKLAELKERLFSRRTQGRIKHVKGGRLMVCYLRLLADRERKKNSWHRKRRGWMQPVSLKYLYDMGREGESY